LVVVKRDGRKETYSREKIVKGLKRALEKRPITDDNFKKLSPEEQQNKIKLIFIFYYGKF